MVQSPSWEANWSAASHEIPRISRNPKVHYRTHKRPPPVSILGQPYPVHIPTSHLLEVHPNIMHPSTSRSPRWSLSLRFPHQDPIHPLSSPIRATCPAHLILLDFITRTILGEEYKSFSSALCNLLHSPLPLPLPSVYCSIILPSVLRYSRLSQFRLRTCSAVVILNCPPPAAHPYQPHRPSNIRLRVDLETACILFNRHVLLWVKLCSLMPTLCFPKCWERFCDQSTLLTNE